MILKSITRDLFKAIVTMFQPDFSNFGSFLHGRQESVEGTLLPRVPSGKRQMEMPSLISPMAVVK